MEDEERFYSKEPKDGEKIVYNKKLTKDEQTELFSNLSRDKYASWAKVVQRNVNDYTRPTPSFTKYSKDDISTYLADPYRYEKQLRDAVIYIYGASSRFRRIIQYFVGLTDWCYVVSPYKIDPSKANANTINRNYRKVLETLSSMNIRTQFPKILTVCLREDVFYGTFIVAGDSIQIQRLPSDYCCIEVIEGGVPNVSFNFSYFDTYKTMLQYYPAEFTTKYNAYRNDITNLKWQMLESPNSFAVKCSDDIYEYAIPPLAGILREIYDIEDYKDLKLTKSALENYAMLWMKLPMDDDGNWTIEYNKAKKFWDNLNRVVPEEIGTILTPMDIEKIGFEKSNVGDTDTVAEAEASMYSNAGVSSLLFNNDKASANALNLSIKADQAITYGIVKNVENAVNRFIQSQNYGKNFKLTFLDVSRYNRDEAGNMALKMCQYGIPMVSHLCSIQGLGQAELDSMNFLENEVLRIKDTFIPLKSSTNTSSKDLNSTAATDEGGAPLKDIGDLTDSGEQSREDGDDW